MGTVAPIQDQPRSIDVCSTSSGAAERGAPAATRSNPWRRNRIRDYLSFVIPAGESVLFYGCEDGDLLDALNPSAGVGVDDQPSLLAEARSRHPQHEFLASDGFRDHPDGLFEYVVINDVMDDVEDVYNFLVEAARRCSPTGRIIIIQPNYLRRPLQQLAAWFGARDLRRRRNLLSAGDIGIILQAVGLELVDVRPKLFCQRRWLGLGPLANGIAGVLPFAHRFSGVNLLIARQQPSAVASAPSRTASIVMAMRDERDNVAPMVDSIPQCGAETEIIIVEGHSRDGTREEIRRVMHARPEKNVRLVVQTGDGVGNAIYEGFKAARGDVVILLEADRTSPAEDVLKVFDVIAKGRADYVNGSRFIYPLGPGAMPALNVLGNWLFAVWFMWFLGQRTSDVLCGLKGFDRRQFTRVDRNWGFLGLTDPFSDFEMLFGATRLGLKICEVPTRYQARVYGQTKTRFFKHGWMLARMAMRATGVFRCR